MDLDSPTFADRAGIVFAHAGRAILQRDDQQVELRSEARQAIGETGSEPRQVPRLALAAANDDLAEVVLARIAQDCALRGRVAEGGGLGAQFLREANTA